MTEHANKSNEEMASDFIVSTCQLLPKSFFDVSDYTHDLLHIPKEYSFLCGSHAEFYIRPPITCIGDTDFLFSKTDDLVFSGDFLVLPSDVSGLAETITCYKIHPCNRYPGFVLLRPAGTMNYNWKYKKYKFRHRPTSLANNYVFANMDHIARRYGYNSTLSPNKVPSELVYGPAIKKQTKQDYYLDSDVVYSKWCPDWPKETLVWLQRPRNNGWPTIDTIAEVKRNGCHVVYVQHRSCRDDNAQWRFSFSVAEVILIQSWTHVQQIVYHMLRFFAKRELIQKICRKKDEVLCTYHLKTLMLWTCEEMPLEWWNSSSVIAICCELLKKLSEWLKRRKCPNYFIPDANLFHKPSRSRMLDNVKGQLNKFGNSNILCSWFVENYILPVTRRHVKPKSVMEVMPNFVLDYMLEFVEVLKVSESRSLDLLFFSTVIYSCQNIRTIIKNRCLSGPRYAFRLLHITRCLESKTHNGLIDLPTIRNVLCFTYYDNLLYILQAAYGLGCGEISWDSSLFVEIVNTISMQPKIIRSKYHNFPKTYTAETSQFQFLRAQDLMQNLTGSNTRPELQLLSLMAKEVLRKALDYGLFESIGIAIPAFVYLAALHFAASEYQQAIRFCLKVLGDQTSQKDKETLNAACLLFIDDVARIVGLCVLHMKITYNNLHYIGKRLFLDLRLSPEVFAHYLTILSTERLSTHLDFNQELPESEFPMDDYLKALIKPKCAVLTKSGPHFNTTRQKICRTTELLTEDDGTSMNSVIDKETVIGVLMEYALENMTSFYSVIHKDFGIQCNTIDCYRALYHYKCRQYDQVMLLCERILHEPDLQSDLKKFLVANVFLLPPLDSYFDRDVQSLLGFHTLFHYLSPLNDDLRKAELANIMLAHCCAYNMDGPKDELTCFLLCHYSSKHHYFLGRYFLARYLKVRCCIDCNLPFTEALTEFSAQKTNLPFERIIHRFLLQKLRIIK